MTETGDAKNRDETLASFTRQVDAFTAKMSPHSTGDVLQPLFDRLDLNGRETVLDVACGPGLVAFSLADRTARVTGIDRTPAMIEKAKAIQAERGVQNVDWVVGSAEHLPFGEGRFDLVVTRFSLHHFQDPKAALGEMARVCRPGGKVAVIDVMPDSRHQEAFNRFELLRDPSHGRAFTEGELREAVREAGLKETGFDRQDLDLELEQQLAASFTRGGDEAELRGMVASDLTEDNLGIARRRPDGSVYLVYPVGVFVSTRPA